MDLMLTYQGFLRRHFEHPGDEVIDHSAIDGLQPFPEDLKDKSAAAMLVDGTKQSCRN